MAQSKNSIGVFAPSSWVEEDDLKKSTHFLQTQGYEIFIHPQTYMRHNQSAGTHEEKLNAFYELWDNPDIDIIWSAGGGNRCLHWIDQIDYSRLNKPKTVIGFSDVTALLNALYAHKGFKSYHGPTFNRAHKAPQIHELLGIIRDEKFSYHFEDVEIFHSGTATGHLIGGNLSVFQYLPQTLPGNFWQGGILFLEDCNEELSRLDRMLLHLKRLGIFEQINGLILGDFGEMPETGKPYGFSLKEVIQEHTADINIPIMINAPFGHGYTLWPLPIGQTAFMQGNLIHSA